MQLQRRQFWLIILVQTVFFVALAAWVLVRLDRIFEPVSLLVALAIIVIGDLAAVLMMQRVAPTRITFSAGEHELTGQALDGFGPDDRGRVVVTGEKWLARCLGSERIAPGDRVRIVSRSGLTLDVERIGGPGGKSASDAREDGPGGKSASDARESGPGRKSASDAREGGPGGKSASDARESGSGGKSASDAREG